MRRRRGARKTTRVPERGKAPRTFATNLRVLGLGLLCAKVILVPVVFDYGADLPFVVPKAMLSHALTYLLIGVLAGLFIVNGRTFFVWSSLHIPVIAFLGVAAVATAFAADTNLALFGSHSRMLGLGTVADAAVLYFAVVLLVRRPSDVAAIMASVLIASLPVLGYEAVQFSGRDPLKWSLDSAQRPFSTIGEATALAQYLSVLAVGSFSLGVLAPTNRRVRVALIILSLALLAGTAATSTRSPLIGLGAATVVMVLLIWRTHPSRHARIVSLAGAVGGAVMLVAAVLLTPLGARLSTTIEIPNFDSDDELIVKLEPSAAARLTLYQIAYQMVLERPLVGYGPDNFAVGIPRYRPDPAPIQVRQNVATSAHSWIAQVATGTGLAGLVAFLAIPLAALALALRSGFRPAAIAAMAMLAAFLGTGLTTVDEFGTEWLFWVTSGVVAAATMQPILSKDQEDVAAGEDRARRGRPRRPNAIRSWIAPLACVIGGMVLATTPLTALDASRSAHASQSSRLQGSVSQAISLGLRATSGDPRRAEYWHTLGLAYIAGNKLQDAAAAMDRATKLSAYDVRFLGDEVRAQLLLAQAGDAIASAEAIRIADQATRTDPNNPRAQLTKAVAMQVTGDLPQALTAVRRALALDPQSTNPELYVTASQVMSGSGLTMESIQVSRDGIAILGQAKNSVGLRIELARALMASNQLSEALKEIDLALAIQPGEPTAQRVRVDIQAAITRAR